MQPSFYVDRLLKEITYCKRKTLWLDLRPWKYSMLIVTHLKTLFLSKITGLFVKCKMLSSMGLSQVFVGEYLEGLKIALFCIVYFINLLVHASAVGAHFAFRGQRPAIKVYFIVFLGSTEHFLRDFRLLLFPLASSCVPTANLMVILIINLV